MQFLRNMLQGNGSQSQDISVSEIYLKVSSAQRPLGQNVSINKLEAILQKFSDSFLMSFFSIISTISISFSELCT